MKAYLFLAAAPILLASCARTVPVDEFEPDRSVAELAQTNSGQMIGASPNQSQPPQSAQAALNLQAVTAADFGGAMDPMESCSFTSAADELLLVAAAPRGAMERPRAVVRLVNGVNRLDGMRDGGYNYLTEGPAFQNQKGLTITIVRDDNPAAPVSVPVDAANSEPVPGAVEANAQSWPATMTVITDGAEQQYPQGTYTCGI